jgi:hypothetical protein
VGVGLFTGNSAVTPPCPCLPLFSRDGRGKDSQNLPSLNGRCSVLVNELIKEY